MAKAKPFIKWVGGKSQLIDQLDAQLPADFGNWENVTYIVLTPSNSRGLERKPDLMLLQCLLQNGLSIRMQKDLL